MKNAKIALMTLVAGIVSLLVGNATCFGQNLPTPQEHSDWIVQELSQRMISRTPVQKMKQPNDRMPQPKVFGYGGNPKTGDVSYYLHPKTGLSYDFDHGLIYDTSGGKIYQFYKKGSQPKPLPENIEAPKRPLHPGTRL